MCLFISKHRDRANATRWDEFILLKNSFTTHYKAGEINVWVAEVNFKIDVN